MNKFIGYGRQTLVCEHCGKETTRNSNRQKYCPDCKVIVERQKALDRYYAREKTKSTKQNVRYTTLSTELENAEVIISLA